MTTCYSGLIITLSDSRSDSIKLMFSDCLIISCSDLLMVETTADFYQTMSLLSAHLKKGKIITSNEFMNVCNPDFTVYLHAYYILTPVHM